MSEDDENWGRNYSWLGGFRKGSGKGAAGILPEGKQAEILKAMLPNIAMVSMNQWPWQVKCAVLWCMGRIDATTTSLAALGHEKTKIIASIEEAVAEQHSHPGSREQMVPCWCS